MKTYQKILIGAVVLGVLYYAVRSFGTGAFSIFKPVSPQSLGAPPAAIPSGVTAPYAPTVGPMLATRQGHGHF